MTLQEYDLKISELELAFREAVDDKSIEETYDDLIKFQYEHMREFVKAYKETANTSAKKVIADIFDDAVENSQNGSVVEGVKDEALAKEIKNIINDEIGDYMLDTPEVYYDKTDDIWWIDCMFAGNYVPDWDGWRE